MFFANGAIIMKQTFGDFVRQKRLEKVIKLNAFASQIGISNVYLSYIERGSRPAPSKAILQRIERALQLSSDEAALMNSLAILSHNKHDFSEDLIEYINSRPYVIESLHMAMTINASEFEWASFQKMLNLKPSPSHDENR